MMIRQCLTAAVLLTLTASNLDAQRVRLRFIRLSNTQVTDRGFGADRDEFFMGAGYRTSDGRTGTMRTRVHNIDVNDTQNRHNELLFDLRLELGQAAEIVIAAWDQDGSSQETRAHAVRSLIPTRRVEGAASLATLQEQEDRQDEGPDPETIRQILTAVITLAQEIGSRGSDDYVGMFYVRVERPREGGLFYSVSPLNDARVSKKRSGSRKFVDATLTGSGANYSVRLEVQ